MGWPELALAVAGGAACAWAISRFGAPSLRARRLEKGKVLMVVLTGGPCAGKSSSLNVLTSCTRETGYDCYAVPEIPTIMMDGGLRLPPDVEQLVAFEVELLRLQLAAENAWLGVARSTGRPAVVVLDRGAMDVKSYLTPHTWERVLNEVGTTEAELMARYDMVLHLTTAAYGAERHYSVDNNPARRETPAQAREADDKVRAAWEGFREHAVVKNVGGFDQKLGQVRKHILDLISRQARG